MDEDSLVGVPEAHDDQPGSRGLQRPHDLCGRVRLRLTVGQQHDQPVAGVGREAARPDEPRQHAVGRRERRRVRRRGAVDADRLRDRRVERRSIRRRDQVREQTVGERRDPDGDLRQGRPERDREALRAPLPRRCGRCRARRHRSRRVEDHVELRVGANVMRLRVHEHRLCGGRHQQRTRRRGGKGDADAAQERRRREPEQREQPAPAPRMEQCRDRGREHDRRGDCRLRRQEVQRGAQ